MLGVAKAALGLVIACTGVFRGVLQRCGLLFKRSLQFIAVCRHGSMKLAGPIGCRPVFFQQQRLEYDFTGIECDGQQAAGYVKAVLAGGYGVV